jgi:crossover junction endodeoxyribonuclease RuvC
MTATMPTSVELPALANEAPRVVGIDLSLTCTGIAVPGYDPNVQGYTVAIKKPSGQRPENGWSELRRLRWMRSRVLAEVRRFSGGVDSGFSCPVLVVLEGLAFGSKSPHAMTRAGLWWMVLDGLDAMPGVSVAVASPASRAKYATGKGNAGKDVVMREVARRFPFFDGGEDEADALVLRSMGLDHLGVPLAEMPKAHRDALAAVGWPAAADA